MKYKPVFHIDYAYLIRLCDVTGLSNGTFHYSAFPNIHTTTTFPFSTDFDETGIKIEDL